MTRPGKYSIYTRLYSWGTTAQAQPQRPFRAPSALNIPLALQEKIMARKCKLTGKKPLVGNKVSHANNKTKMRQLPNLQRKRIFVPELGKEGRWVRVRLTSRALRTVSKKGLMAYLRDAKLTLKDVTS